MVLCSDSVGGLDGISPSLAMDRTAQNEAAKGIPPPLSCGCAVLSAAVCGSMDGIGYRGFYSTAFHLNENLEE